MAARAATRKRAIPVEDKAELALLVIPTMQSAQQQGLLETNESRLTARMSAKLIAAAKARTGIKSNSELLKFAIAQLAVEDPFKKAFRELEGTVDPDLDLEF